MSEEFYLETKRAELVTKWPLVAYLMSALVCLGMSAACHLTYVRSEQVSKITTYLDYWGIALLFLGSAYPYISFKYACGSFIVWRYIFTSMTTVLMFICMWATVQKQWMTPERRAALFILFFISICIPFGLLFIWHDPLYSLDPWPAKHKYAFWAYFAGVFIYV